MTMVFPAKVCGGVAVVLSLLSLLLLPLFGPISRLLCPAQHIHIHLSCLSLPSANFTNNLSALSGQPCLRGHGGVVAGVQLCMSRPLVDVYTTLVCRFRSSNLFVLLVTSRRACVIEMEGGREGGRKCVYMGVCICTAPPAA